MPDGTQLSHGHNRNITAVCAIVVVVLGDARPFLLSLCNTTVCALSTAAMVVIEPILVWIGQSTLCTGKDPASPRNHHKKYQHGALLVALLVMQ